MCRSFPSFLGSSRLMRFCRFGHNYAIHGERKSIVKLGFNENDTRQPGEALSVSVCKSAVSSLAGSLSFDYGGEPCREDTGVHRKTVS